MSVDLSITILLAIPLAIIANLVTPKVRDIIDSRAEKSQIKKKEATEKSRASSLARITKELEAIREYKNDSQKYYSYLLEVMIRATLYGAMTGLYAGMLSALAYFMRNSDFSRDMIVTMAQLIGMLGSMLIFMVSWQGLKVIRRVQSFDAFETEANEKICALSEVV